PEFAFPRLGGGAGLRQAPRAPPPSGARASGPPPPAYPCSIRTTSLHWNRTTTWFESAKVVRAGRRACAPVGVRPTAGWSRGAPPAPAPVRPEVPARPVPARAGWPAGPPPAAAPPRWTAPG